MRVENLNLLLTYRCPSQCEHCRYFAGPRGTGRMEARDVERYLSQLEDHPLREVWISGGEPFIHFRTLMEVTRAIGEWNVTRVGIVTNGFWATEMVKAVGMLSQLKGVGLTDLHVSTDGFHAEYIHPHVALIALKAAVEAGLASVTSSTTFIRSARFPNSFDETSREIVDALSEIHGIEVQRAKMTLLGRAAEGLWVYCKTHEGVPSGRCTLPGYIGGDLREPTGVEIDPFGWVQLCPGIGLGNVADRPLDEIVDHYDCAQHPILSRLAQDGPRGLLPEAQRLGFAPKAQYVDECHLCYDLRKFLRPQHRGYLTLRGYVEF